MKSFDSPISGRISMMRWLKKLINCLRIGIQEQVMAPTNRESQATESDLLEFVKLEKLLSVIFRLMMRRAPDPRDQAFIVATLALMYLKSVSDDPEFHDQIMLKLIRVIAQEEIAKDGNQIDDGEIQRLLDLADEGKPH